MQRRQGSVEDVVDALVAAGSLDGGDAGGFFDDADETLIANGVRAVSAGVNV
jgi:hypothetical protein